MKNISSPLILSFVAISLHFAVSKTSAQQATTTPKENRIQKTQISLPITWDDSANIDYTIIDFGGNTSQIASDPSNPSNLVLKVIKTSAAETWAGSTLGTASGFATPLPFTVDSAFISIRVFAPNSGMQIRLKAEDSNDPTKSVETPATTTIANGWQILTFNFANQAPGTAAINYSFNYNKLSIFFNFGVDGVTAGAKTFYLDNVKMGAGIVSSKMKIDLPITWDDTAHVDYTTTDFAGDSSELSTDPLDPTNFVLKINRTAASITYAGTTLGTDFGLANPIPLTAINRFMSVRVYSPDAGVKVRLKVENINGGGVNVETDQFTTTANQWENLTFDFAENAPGTPAINYSNVHNKVVIFFSFGENGSTLGSKIYYVDNVIFGTFTEVEKPMEVNSISLFPNPTTGSFQVKATLRQGNSYRIRLIDQLGKSVHEETGNGAEINRSVQVPHLNSGIYQCQIVSDGHISQSRLVIH